ncbi:hypothetical protein PR048_027346 [Dryococelus australis]|uniref:Uncharacterized protein n=1 Tax=Dryococelus australis TaxID=614101 RepID=A0ABQ9GF80_9NEOP|nr:hypothetical protein PR048_027346 [Dryococelus australis]
MLFLFPLLLRHQACQPFTGSCKIPTPERDKYVGNAPYVDVLRPAVCDYVCKPFLFEENQLTPFTCSVKSSQGRISLALPQCMVWLAKVAETCRKREEESVGLGPARSLSSPTAVCGERHGQVPPPLPLPYSTPTSPRRFPGASAGGLTVTAGITHTSSAVRHDGNAARLARRSDETLEVRVTWHLRKYSIHLTADPTCPLCGNTDTAFHRKFWSAHKSDAVQDKNGARAIKRGVHNPRVTGNVRHVSPPHKKNLGNPALVSVSSCLADQLWVTPRRDWADRSTFRHSPPPTRYTAPKLLLPFPSTCIPHKALTASSSRLSTREVQAPSLVLPFLRHPMRVLEANIRKGETGDPRESPPTNGIVRHDSDMRKSGVTQPGIEPGSP